MKLARPVLITMSCAGLLFEPPCFAASTNHLDLARELNEAFVGAASKVIPSVVVITVTERPGYAGNAIDDQDMDSTPTLPPEGRGHFHHPYRDAMPERGQGSGVIIRRDGYIVTNAHVVEDADAIEVRLRDGRVFKARVRGVDVVSDVAVLQIEANDLPVAEFADSNLTRVGEFALAVGAPFSYDFSVTFGHVSAKGRANVIPAFAGGWAMDQDFLQTDANINPGNSGGPLVNLDGQVIGINTVIQGLQTGIGFAVPSNLVREVAEQLIEQGKVVRAWLGVGIRSLRDDEEYLPLVDGVRDGVVVQSILPGGPAAASELKASDVIISLDSVPVSTAQQLRAELRHKKVGATVSLEVWRAGERRRVSVVTGEAPERQPPVRTERPVRVPAPSGLGMTVHPLTRELAAQFGVAIVPGVIVVSVDRDGLASSKGIQPGDVITSVDHRAVSTTEAFSEAVRAANLKKGVVVVVASGEASRFEVLRLESP
jgi:serine protease Do